VLAAAGIVIFVAVATPFGSLNERQRGIDNAVRKNLLWAVLQTDREAQRFMATITRAQLDPTEENLAEILTSFDLLYSRADTLSEGHYSLKLRGTDAVASAARSAATG